MRGSMDLRQRSAACSVGRTVAGLAMLSATTLCLSIAGGCASEGTKTSETKSPTVPDSSKAVELRYRALAQNLSLGLVNESHSSRTEVYSERQPLDRATTKVSTDEVVDEIVSYFREQGFFEIALRGAAPAAPKGVSQMLEVALPDGKYYLALRQGVTKEYARTFQTCAKALLDLYNGTMQLQAVEDAPDWMNGTARPATKSKKPGG